MAPNGYCDVRTRLIRPEPVPTTLTYVGFRRQGASNPTALRIVLVDRDRFDAAVLGIEPATVSGKTYDVRSLPHAKLASPFQSRDAVLTQE